ncbi:hypothetical protein TNCT_727141 [Trichonephila clavata]|uniref:Uncharacterized protein n=1 Tax=Trichonephila clavata TaxID=2740835 RepID=A0A8X6G6I2_TRICU|nr:hypothetical protein TNCT_727141 [Trichonephila clavata]
MPDFNAFHEFFLFRSLGSPSRRGANGLGGRPYPPQDYSRDGRVCFFTLLKLPRGKSSSDQSSRPPRDVPRATLRFDSEDSG